MVVLNLVLVALSLMMEAGRPLEASVVVRALEDLVVQGPLHLVVGMDLMGDLVAGMALVALVAGGIQLGLVDGRVLGPVVLEEEGGEVLVGEVEQALVVLVVVVAEVILLVLVDVAGVVILLVLVDVAGVIFLVLVDEAGEISLVDVVGGGVDLAVEDGLIEVHMIGMSQMEGEDMMAVGGLATRVEIGATAVAQIEAAHEDMTEVIGARVGAEAAAGVGRVVEAAVGAGHAAEAAAAAVVAAGAGAMTMVQDQNAGPEQDRVLMCFHRVGQDLL